MFSMPNKNFLTSIHLTVVLITVSYYLKVFCFCYFTGHKWNTNTCYYLEVVLVICIFYFYIVFTRFIK